MPCPKPQPNYKVRYLYQNSILTSKYYQVLASDFYDKEVKEYIIWKTKWTPNLFEKVNWLSNERAFKRLPQTQKISSAKLIYILANTNCHNHLLYNTSALCPRCLDQKETFQHVLTCPLPSTVQSRDTQVELLQKSLEGWYMPGPVIAMIFHGFKNWLSPTIMHFCTLRYGSLLVQILF